MTRDARAKADALERDARQRHQEAMGGLDAKRTALQKHIEELKQFEREYRTRLKAYLESQLRDLDGREQGLEAEMTRAEAAGRVGGNTGGLATVGLGRLLWRTARRRRPLGRTSPAVGDQLGAVTAHNGIPVGSSDPECRFWWSHPARR